MPTKILAIDDSKTIRLAIKITFAAEDAEVVAVSKGSEAVARAGQMAADVVLVDHTLAAGEPSGWDVCRALKADASTASIPVVMLTHGAPDEAKLAECGADGGLAKPFDTQALIDKVKAVAGQPSARPAAAAAAAPKPASRPAVSPPRPASPPAPAAARPAAAPAGKPPVRAPAPSPVAAAPRPAVAPAARPAAAPAARPAAAAPAAAAAAPGGGKIPIAVPIPFTAANAPTPGILKRIQEASGAAAAGLDPKTAAALIALSKEVVEQVVWEVVPELAEAIIKEHQAKAG